MQNKQKKFIMLMVGLFLAIPAVSYGAESLGNRLKGYILLQVQDQGKAWYINVDDGKRYYMKDGMVAYEMLRNFGTGITNNDLAKIPIGINSNIEDRLKAKVSYVKDIDNDSLSDKLEEALGTNLNNSDTDGDGYSDGNEIKEGYNPLGSGKMQFDQKLSNRLKGRVMLQVQSRGEAWYINPTDGKRYYMQDGSTAFEMMKFLSLGINNDNLKKFSVGTIEVPLEKIVFKDLNEASKNPTRVQHLELMGQELNDFPQAIFNFTNLVDLDLGHNHITVIPEEIGQLKNLEKLSLAYNNITEIPSQIGELTKLTRLEFSGNFNLKIVPATLTNLINLTWLSFNDTVIEILPDGMDKLINLKHLFINHINLDQDHINELQRLLPNTNIYE